mmetsp:Transcript_28937/g.92447  ORF Transcript_28937/g.92447 Transcript_28937/m.92447 type:complete len:247 (+) Transcript_28937:822-1562(+)
MGIISLELLHHLRDLAAVGLHLAVLAVASYRHAREAEPGLVLAPLLLIPLVHLLRPAGEAHVRGVRQPGEDGEQSEGDDGLLDGDDVRGPVRVHDQHPDVRQNGEGCRDQEHRELRDAAHLAVGDGHGAHRRDGEQVEGRGPHNGGGPELAGGLRVALGQALHGLQDSQEDLRGRRAECHKCQVGHRGVPVLDLNVGHLAGLQVLLLDLLHTAGDSLNRGHEHIADDCNPEETVDEPQEVGNCESL